MGTHRCAGGPGLSSHLPTWQAEWHRKQERPRGRSGICPLRFARPLPGAAVVRGTSTPLTRAGQPLPQSSQPGKEEVRSSGTLRPRQGRHLPVPHLLACAPETPAWLPAHSGHDLTWAGGRAQAGSRPGYLSTLLTACSTILQWSPVLGGWPSRARSVGAALRSPSMLCGRQCGAGWAGLRLAAGTRLRGSLAA